MKFLAQRDVIGTIKPPVGLEKFATSPIDSTSRLLTIGIRLFLIFSGLTALFYLLRGGFDWITSGGDKEKLSAAQQRVYNAIVGMLLLIVVLAIIATLEQVVFDKKFCFGLTCGIQLPSIAN